MLKEILDSDSYFNRLNTKSPKKKNAFSYKNSSRLGEIAEELERIKTKAMKNQPSQAEIEKRNHFEYLPLKLTKVAGTPGSAIREHFYVDLEQIQQISSKDSRLQVRYLQICDLYSLWQIASQALGKLKMEVCFFTLTKMTS